jgi:Arc/MetJ-type ribon-helix-helix transcriptional regulator
MGTRQITVRLPVELVEYLDKEVAEEGTSRASFLTEALKHARRRRMAEHDALIYARLGESPESVAIAAAVADTALTELD